MEIARREPCSIMSGSGRKRPRPLEILRQRFQSELVAVRRLLAEAAAVLPASSPSAPRVRVRPAEEPPAKKRKASQAVPVKKMTSKERSQLYADLTKLAKLSESHVLPAHILELLKKQSRRGICDDYIEIEMHAVQDEALVEMQKQLDKFVRERANPSTHHQHKKMVAAGRDRRRRGRAPWAASAVAGEDDREEHHLNPFPLGRGALVLKSPVQVCAALWLTCLCCWCASGSFIGLYMLWCRNVASRARWVEEAGAAEVLDNKGKLWLTTGITRGGQLYYNVEEIGFLAERGALVLLDDKDETAGVEEIYGKIAGGSYGCSWDAFQAYRHLKLLGYIVGRYDVPWTMKHIHSGEVTGSPESMVGTSQSFDRADDACNDITKLLKGMHMDGMYPSFKVHLPNSKFKKSSPGVPSFLVCLLRDKPPSRDELETMENKFDGIPLKFCQVDNWRISFLSFDKVTLPSLP